MDRQALCLLHEMHNGDIRSCINALQTISYDCDGHVDVMKLREKGSSVRVSRLSCVRVRVDEPRELTELRA